MSGFGNFGEQLLLGDPVRSSEFLLLLPSLPSLQSVSMGFSSRGRALVFTLRNTCHIVPSLIFMLSFALFDVWSSSLSRRWPVCEKLR